SSQLLSGHTFVDKLDKMMEITDTAEEMKKLNQYEDWEKNVHRVIQEQIDEAVAAMDSRDINERRRGDMQKFLTTTNTKAAIFRDIIIESEYDPLEPNRQAIKVHVGVLRNPCSRVLDKRAEENNLLAAEG
ncbi:unnamed protein product, partial [Choristocarpus tenellus]